MSQYGFGTGQLHTTPVGGGAPLRIGALQDVSVEFSGDVKQLFGQYQFPLDAARGKTKIEGKIGTANIDVAAFNQFFFGQTVTGNSEKVQVVNEAAAVPGSTTYTVTAANGASFYLDLGVYYAASGLPLKQVSSAPSAAGEYQVNPTTGLYTFHSGDASAAVLLNYIYTATTSKSGTLNITNQLMGVTPKFQMVLSQRYNNQSVTMVLYAAVADKLSMPMKQDDYVVSEIGFSAYANAAGQVGFISTTSAVGGGG